MRGQWESYKIAVVNNPLPKSHPEIKRALLIVGSDRRGTAYGTFAVSESIGVSPWYWWADVPPTRHTNLFLASQTINQGPPSVKYRGLFINDEDFGMKPWASKTFDPATGNIGPKTYAKVFELLLRLRANFCWPAMHPISHAFNFYPDDKKVADDYAIVMGASHCEPMLVNNAVKSEWDSKVDGPWNYETNAAGMDKVWDARLQTNGQYENVYTVGMRGIHDAPMPGNGTPTEKARILEKVIADQREILHNRTGKSANQVPQIFIPYKEVLGIYRTGMKVPDDITLVWVDDNHGYLRQLSNPQEQKRGGRFGRLLSLFVLGRARRLPVDCLDFAVADRLRNEQSVSIWRQSFVGFQRRRFETRRKRVDLRAQNGVGHQRGRAAKGARFPAPVGGTNFRPTIRRADWPNSEQSIIVWRNAASRNT